MLNVFIKLIPAILGAIVSITGGFLNNETLTAGGIGALAPTAVEGAARSSQSSPRRRNDMGAYYDARPIMEEEMTSYQEHEY